MKFFSLSLAAIVFATAVPAASFAGITTVPSARITAAVERQLTSSGVPGAQVIVLKHGRIVYERCFGVRRLGGPPVRPATRFEIGSDTKQFTAAAILQLKENGRLRLDDRLAKYVPAFPHAKEITLRELLDQTSGLPDYVLTNHFLHITQTSAGSFERIEHLAAGPLHFTPGSRWEYSNANYVALGRVIEIASGQTYDAYIAAHLFARAGMTQTTTIAHEAQVADMATGYWRGRERKGPFVPAPEIGASWTWAAGEIVSTTADLAKWDRALQSGRIISASDFALMTSPARLKNGKLDDYGFGWWIDPVAGHIDVYHDGDTYGMSSSNNLFPADGIDVIVLENAADDAAADTARAIFRAIVTAAA